jgi:hypothetical protein
MYSLLWRLAFIKLIANTNMLCFVVAECAGGSEDGGGDENICLVVSTCVVYCN